MEGYVIRYEPRAFAVETASATMREEQKRKIRIAAGAFQAMGILKNLFNFRRYPILSFQYISHRVLRWTLCPISLIVCFISNFLLVHYEAAGFYLGSFTRTDRILCNGCNGLYICQPESENKALYIPYYFLFMNLSVFMGFYRFIRNKQTALWEKAARHSQLKNRSGHDFI